MRVHCVGLLGALVLLAIPVTAWADIPPPPPPGLDKTPGMRSNPIAVAGVAVSLAVVLSGALLARYRTGVMIPTVALTVLVLVAAGLLAWRAERAWADHAALKAGYDKTLANWRPLGPVPRPRPPRLPDVARSVAMLSFAPQDGFPSSLPWAALGLNGNAGPLDHGW